MKEIREIRRDFRKVVVSSTVKFNMDYKNEDDYVVVGENGSKMKISILLISMKVEKKVSDIIGANNVCKATNETMNESGPKCTR